MTGRRAFPALALVLVTAMSLGGCAAAAIPVVAGAVVARKTTDGPDRKIDPQVAAPPASRAPISADSSASAPPGAPPADGYAAFVSYAVQQAMVPGPRRSMLVDPQTLTSGAKLLDCEATQPAVVLDLDPGKATFDLADPPLPQPGLAGQLAALRRAGLTVLWSAALPVKDAQKLWTVLQASGLDPDRTDRLLLLRKSDERKQQRRLAAAKDWCIVAIAGDRPGDFEEALEYLRDPDGPIAQALKPNFGAGWFLAPPPIK